MVWGIFLSLAFSGAGPASAHHDSSHTAVQSFYSYNTSRPYLVFDKVENSNSTLTAYASFGAERYRIRMRAGSGTSKNECQKYKGWLPNGLYYPNFYFKNWGLPVVQGHVWDLGSKWCWNGSEHRTGLFIHSSGIEGTSWNGVYTSEGCIKISQLDRYSGGGPSLRPFLRGAYDRDNESLTVR